MNRPAPISGLLRPAPDEIHHLIPHIMRHPRRGQSSPRLFLTRCAPPSTRPRPRPWSAPSSPRTQSVSASPPPGGEDAPLIGRQPLRSRSTLSASGTTRWVAAPVPHTDRKPGPCLKDGVVESPPSLQQCSACALFSYVRSAILTDERFLHFQLRRDTMYQPFSFCRMPKRWNSACSITRITSS